jgi:hypothetical protein
MESIDFLAENYSENLKKIRLHFGKNKAKIKNATQVMPNHKV